MEFFATAISRFITGLTQNAQQLGALSVAAVWAMVALAEGLYIFFDARSQNKARELSLEVRLKDAESDILLANGVLSKFKDMEDRLDHLKELFLTHINGANGIGGKDVA